MREIEGLWENSRSERNRKKKRDHGEGDWGGECHKEGGGPTQMKEEVGMGGLWKTLITW